MYPKFCTFIVVHIEEGIADGLVIMLQAGIVVIPDFGAIIIFRRSPSVAVSKASNAFIWSTVLSNQ